MTWIWPDCLTILILIGISNDEKRRAAKICIERIKEIIVKKVYSINLLYFSEFDD